jgi:SAM-dependent methyltransferase
LPFKPGELKAILMLNVLHHLPRPEDFFREAARCLVPGGRIVMIEPCRTLFSRVLYRRFHHEPFDDAAADWNPPPGGRLSASNQAIAWLIFERDRSRFEREFPALRIRSITRHSALCYPLSGGLSMRALVPAATYSLFSALDRCLSALGPGIFPIFETIVLEKV